MRRKRCLSLIEAQLRDSIIIGLGADEDIRKGEKPVAIVAHLSAKRVMLTESLNGRQVDAPMILLEGDRQRLGAEEFYFDPPNVGPSIPLELYFPKWAGFARLLLSSKIVAAVSQSDYAFALLRRSIEHCRNTRGVASARALVQALHDNRWSIGPEMTAELFTVATWDPAAPATVPSRSTDHEFLKTEIAAVRSQLSQIKQSCRDLTEWCEALYSINPRVWALIIYLRSSDLPDAEKWYRYFAEVDADIAPCSMRDVFSVIRTETGKSGASWQSLIISERAQSTDINEFRQKLQYLLRARTSIPAFWFDLAIQSYDVREEHLPAALDCVDAWRAVSTSVLRASSMVWRQQERA